MGFPILPDLPTLPRKAFKPIHPPGTLSMLDPESHLGPVDPATLPKSAQELTEEEKRIQKAREALPTPEAALNLHDIEVCRRVSFHTTLSDVFRSDFCEDRPNDDRLGLLSLGW